MISSLQFVQGAVAKKDYQPAMTHFRIANGNVLGFNGEIAISCPIPLDLEALPKAVPFVRAIERCEETVNLHLTEAGKLSVRSGKFQAFVDCYDPKEATVLAGIEPEGDPMPVPTGFMEALRSLFPLVGIDASRPWSNGVLFRGQSAYATNNVVLAQYWLGRTWPRTVNVPRHAIAELLRINEEPTHIQLSERSITVHYDGGRWMRAQLYSTDWPEVIDAMLDKATKYTYTIPPGFFAAIETVLPFVDEVGRVFFNGGKISTSLSEGEGAAVEVPGIPAEGCYNAKYLLMLSGIAERIGFSEMPTPFQGGAVRGIILPMRTS